MSLKVPPFDREAEQSVLGGCLLSTDAARRSASLVSSEDFYFDSHRIIFKAIESLLIENKPTDIVSVKGKLEEKRQLIEVGGISYLAKLANSVPNWANAPYYAKVVKDKSLRRQIIEAGNKISELGFQLDDVNSLIHQARNFLNISDQNSIQSVAERMYNILDKINKEPPDIPLGIKELDKLVRLYNGDLVLIEGQRKNGKTTFSMNLLLRWLKKGYKCMLATYEVPADVRYIPMLSMMYAKKYPYNKDEELQQVATFISDLGEQFYTLPENTYLEDFETAVLDFVKENNIDFIVVDYDQLVKTKEKYRTEERRVSAISRAFKHIAMEGDCVVIMLSQVNKEGEGRWSAEKENDASVVLRLEKDPVLNELKIWIAYNRYGKALSKENAISLIIDWDRRLIENE